MWEVGGVRPLGRISILGGSRMAWFRVVLSSEQQQVVTEERESHPRPPHLNHMAQLLPEPSLGQVSVWSQTRLSEK